MVQNPEASEPSSPARGAYRSTADTLPANRRRRHLPMVDSDGRLVVVWAVQVTADQHRPRAIAVVVEQVRAWGREAASRLTGAVPPASEST